MLATEIMHTLQWICFIDYVMSRHNRHFRNYLRSTTSFFFLSYGPSSLYLNWALQISLFSSSLSGHVHKKHSRSLEDTFVLVRNLFFATVLMQEKWLGNSRISDRQYCASLLQESRIFMCGKRIKSRCYQHGFFKQSKDFYWADREYQILFSGFTFDEVYLFSSFCPSRK